MLELYWKSNINQLYRRPPGRLNGGVWGGGCPPRNQVKFRLLAAPGQYSPNKKGHVPTQSMTCLFTTEPEQLKGPTPVKLWNSKGPVSICK